MAERGIVALLKTMKPPGEDFPEIVLVEDDAPGDTELEAR